MSGTFGTRLTSTLLEVFYILAGQFGRPNETKREYGLGH